MYSPRTLNDLHQLFSSAPVRYSYQVVFIFTAPAMYGVWDEFNDGSLDYSTEVT